METGGVISKGMSVLQLIKATSDHGQVEQTKGRARDVRRLKVTSDGVLRPAVYTQGDRCSIVRAKRSGPCDML